MGGVVEARLGNELARFSSGIEVVGLVLTGDSRDQVLRRMCAELEKRGVTDAEYAEAVIQREETFPTGLPTEGICVAVPHGDPQHVIRSGVVVARIRDGVRFRRMDAPDQELEVKVVFMLAMKGGEQQVAALKAIMQMVQDSSFLKKVAQARSAEEVEKLVVGALRVGN